MIESCRDALQNRSEQACGANGQFEEKGPADIIIHGGRLTAGKIIRQHGFDVSYEKRIIIQERDFKIQPERSIVQIGGADGGTPRINQKYFLVHKPGGVAVYFNS